MPGTRHEALIELIRRSPDMLRELLAPLIGEDLPPDVRVEVASESVGQSRAVERRADLVLCFGEDGPVIPVEIQLGIDRDKEWIWPEYVVGSRSSHRRRAALAVLTPSAAVARWASRPIQIGPGSVITPIVIGPEQIPLVTDATRSPELLVLSVMARGKEEGAEPAAWAALEAARRVDEDTRALYVDLILDAVPAALQRKLEDAMLQGYEYKSEFLRRLLEEGRQEGLKEGREEGREEGLRIKLRQAILSVLDVRQLPVSDEVHATLEATADLDTLERWLRAAVTAPTADAAVAS